MSVAVLVFVVTALQNGRPSGTLECPSPGVRRSLEYAPNGSTEWCVGTNGLRQGPTRSYYSNGRLLFSGEYIDGAVNGTATYYLNDGTIWRRDEWQEGALQANWLNPETLALSRGQLVERGAVGGRNDVGTPIICGPRDQRPECSPPPSNPVRVLRYQNGRLRARGEVSEGERSGEWTFWYSSGALAKRAEFSGGPLSGRYQEWRANGRPAAEGEYLSGEKAGLWLYWDDTGRARRERHCK